MELDRVVNAAAARYAARCWWAELEDLRQEGWVAALEAQQTWDPGRGVPLHGYAWRAVVNHLGNYLWTQCSPVTGRKNHGKSLQDVRRVSAEVLIGHHADDPLETERAEAWWARMREQAKLVVEGGRHGDVAARVLLRGERVAAVAESVGWPVHKVWRADHVARQRIAEDTDLRHEYAAGIQEMTCQRL